MTLIQFTDNEGLDFLVNIQFQHVLSFHCPPWHISGILYAHPSHFLSLMSLTCPFPPLHFLASYRPHNRSFTPSAVSQAGGSFDSTYPSNRAERGTYLSSETYKPPDRTEGEYQTVSACVSVRPHHHRFPPSPGGPSHSRQKQWIRLPSETTRIWSFKCSRSSSNFWLKRDLCVRNNTNETNNYIFNLFVLLCF